MLAGPQLLHQMSELDRVLDFLEQMNAQHQTAVPMKVIKMLQASGLEGTIGLEPMALMPRVLDRQQLLRRQLASIRRTRAS